MEFDTKLLNELLDFLRKLEDLQLPPMFDTLRRTLLGRMQTALSSGDNYIDMKPGKKIHETKSIVIVNNDSTAEEYVTPDQHPVSPRSFLYPHPNKKPAFVKTNQNVSNTSSESEDAVPSSPPPRIPQPPAVVDDDDEVDVQIVKEEDTVDPFIEIYSNMNVVQAEAKSHMFGQLQRREKIFIIEKIRPFWAVLVGSHFLSYDKRADSKPTQILSIKGSTCKAVQRNAKRLSESTFELCWEDDKCFQFIASCLKEMEQWIAAVRRCEKKSQDPNNVTQTQIEALRISKSIPEVEQTSRVSTSSEVYEDIVISDIPNAPATGMNPKRKLSSHHSGHGTIQNGTKLKTEPQKTAKKIIKRDLPPPPSVSSNQNDDDEMLYHIIDEPRDNKICKNGNSDTEIRKINSSINDENLGDSTEELYDDILTVKREVEKIANKNNEKKMNEVVEKNNTVVEDNEETYDDVNEVRKEVEKIVNKDNKRNINEVVEKNNSFVEADNEETYDDVNEVRKEIKAMNKNDNTVKKSSVDIENQKSDVKESPKITSTKNSPMKCFFDRFRQKSESPNKEKSKKKQAASSPQQSNKIDEKTSPKNDDNCLNDKTIDDLSNYNSPPPPRPVHNGEINSNEILEDEEEAIYDDIANRNRKPGATVSPENLELGKRNKVPFNEETRARSLSSVNLPQNKVARNLSAQFDDQIYQNQPGEDDSEHYQVPRADAINLRVSKSIVLEEDDDDSEKIYDDVQIVAKKKRENEEIKQKTAVTAAQSHSKYNRGTPPATMTKPLDNFFQNGLNKFSLLVAEKSSASDKKFQNRFGGGKKNKIQDVIIPAETKQIADASDNDIYDDCQART